MGWEEPNLWGGRSLIRGVGGARCSHQPAQPLDSQRCGAPSTVLPDPRRRQPVKGWGSAVSWVFFSWHRL